MSKIYDINNYPIRYFYDYNIVPTSGNTQYRSDASWSVEQIYPGQFGINIYNGNLYNCLVNGEIVEYLKKGDVVPSNGSYVNVTGDTMTGALTINANLIVTGNTYINSLAADSERIITTSGSSLLQNYLPTDSSFITNSTIIAALLLETNWPLETYIGTTIGAVENQYYQGYDYRYFYDNSTFVRIPISTNANIKTASATITASTPINTGDTIVSISISIPKNTLVAGSTYEITLFGTCTSSNADTSTFTGRIGTLNTVADAALFTKTLTSAGSGTDIPFCLKIRVTVRTIGATATIYGHTELMNEGTTGIYTAVTEVGALTSVSTHDSTANNYLNISYVTDAVTTTTTFQNVIIQKIR